MKPLQLVLQAFGPFSGSENIDFTVLGTHPLFLINGPTGAGKSSILDAICYALYGQTTGNERDAAQMRCDYASAATLTEVSFVFALGAKRYRIRRVPLQERAKARGEGTTTQQPEAQLWHMHEGEETLLVAKSVTDATAEIRQLLGLSVEQFRQVMVLPQGKFRELLMADSKEREKIFGQLFQTQIYRKIEENLKARSAAIRQQVDEQRNQVKGILQSADLADADELERATAQLQPLLEQASDEKQQAETLRLQATKALEAAEEVLRRMQRLSQLQTQQAELDAQAPEIETKRLRIQRHHQAQKLQPLHESLKEQERSLRGCQTALKQSLQMEEEALKQLHLAQAKYEKAEENAARLEPLQQQLLELHQYRALSEDLLFADAETKKALAACQQSDSAAKTHAQQCQKLERTLAQNITQQKKHTEALTDFAAEQVQLQQLQQKLEQRSALEQLRGEYKNLAEQKKQADEKLVLHKQRFEAAEYQRKHLEWQWHSGQAALLAMQLQPGEPCAVCGSVEHPRPATCDADAELVTAKQVERAREAEHAARATMQQAREKLHSAQRDLQEHQREGQKFAQQLGDLADQALCAVQEQYDKQRAVVERLLSQHNKLLQLQQQVESQQAQLAVLTEHGERLQQQAREHLEQWRSKQSRQEYIAEQLPESYRQPEALARETERVELTVAELKSALQTSKRALELAQSEWDKASTDAAAQARYEQKQKQACERAQQTWQQALQQGPFSDQADYSEALLLQTQLDKLEQSISQYQQQCAQMTGAIATLEQELADVAKPDLAELEVQKQAQLQRYRQAEQAWRTLDQRAQQLQNVHNKLQQALARNTELEAEYAVYGTLSDVANGQTGDKISLQRFVLSVLLDDVLIQASQRLQLMSKGRYQLVRKLHRAKGNKASGLELEVDDCYTGKSRAVATLSGGESFMAALALALGLSDVVQSYAGGVRLDTLFIDEGFGSLDPESLDLAISTLIDLQASGRTIGIISHVAELKEQMALRLDVKTSTSGSSVHLVAP